MKKVKQVWYNDRLDPEVQNYRTGLVLELEDGTMLMHNSTDVIQPFSKADTTVITAASTDPETGVKGSQNAPEGSRLTSKGENDT